MDKVLVVTGGSRGIGAACARRAAAAGWRVMVNYRADAQAAAQVVADIAAMGGQAVAVSADVAVEADVVALFDAAEVAFGPVTGLINNAGIVQLASPLADMSLARWQQTFDTNATGSFLVARDAIRRMLAQGQGGAIVNMSSMAAALGAPHEFIDYAASKGAVEAMTIGLSREVAGKGIRVNSIRPGLIDTDMQRGSGEADRLGRLIGTVPMGRIGRATEVAEAAIWLLSDAASY
ncbi:MAG: SDR family oxidoreductase, partial [Candidatus Saccharibacteria bacterium]|nr:SDR family oxidoreductase [Pseudorhodobacter sp.]